MFSLYDGKKGQDNWEQPRVIKADQSIQWKSTFGAEFLNGVRRGWWSSKASWMLNSTWQRTEQNRTVLAGKTRSGKIMFQIHQTFAECAADCPRPPRISFWQRVAESPKTAPLGAANCNKSQWPTWINKIMHCAKLAIKRHKNRRLKNFKKPWTCSTKSLAVSTFWKSNFSV